MQQPDKGCCAKSDPGLRAILTLPLPCRVVTPCRSGTSSLPSDVPAPPFPFQLEDIRPSGQPSTPEPTANGSGYGAYGAAQAQNPYASSYGAAAGQQQAYGGYGAAAAPAAASGYGAASAGAGRTYTSPSPSAGYSAAPGYGASTAAGGYGQPAQQPQSSFVPSTSAVPGPAAGGYGAPTSYSSSTGYGQASYGSYGQQAQPAPQVYQPHKRAVSSTQVGAWQCAQAALWGVPCIWSLQALMCTTPHCEAGVGDCR